MVFLSSCILARVFAFAVADPRDSVRLAGVSRAYHRLSLDVDVDAATIKRESARCLRLSSLATRLGDCRRIICSFTLARGRARKWFGSLIRKPELFRLQKDIGSHWWSTLVSLRLVNKSWRAAVDNSFNSVVQPPTDALLATAVRLAGPGGPKEVILDFTRITAAGVTSCLDG